VGIGAETPNNFAVIRKTVFVFYKTVPNLELPVLFGVY